MSSPKDGGSIFDETDKIETEEKLFEDVVKQFNTKAMELFNSNQPTIALKILWALLKELLEWVEGKNRSDLLVLTLNNVGCVHKKQGELKEALWCLNFALKLISKSREDTRDLWSLTYLNASAVLSQLGNHWKSKKFA